MSSKSRWSGFVKQCRGELHDQFPGAIPNRCVICPRHRRPVGPFTQLCKKCCDELFARLAAEFIAGAALGEEPRDEQPTPVVGQLDIYDALDLVEREKKGEAA